MEQIINKINPKKAENDLAYQILKNNGQGLSFRELMQQICTMKSISYDNPQLMAAVHTQINLDNRFIFLGQGNWGLKEWTQTTALQRRSLDEDSELGENEYTNNSHEENELTDGEEEEDNDEDWEE
ncbi:MAG: DNA-directed RNA polymerase subunit delta [Firmicutes bacterium HGW-Firmicutes-12]|jgi:DNA-directed RNA polymerase subunit delta|nr:MAG: DNA-directed RNA polymerase subunit delta [Firmicutes bacterium HGW-Firmicutes-12]